MGRNRLFYSFYSLIGAIGDIILNENMLGRQNEMRRMAQVRELPRAFNQNNRNDITDDIEDYNDPEYVVADNSIAEFALKIRQWQEN